MAELVCVTNDMPDSRPCTTRGAHTDVCDGFEYRWAPELDQYVATGKACHGCVPRVASHGMLCHACWTSLQAAEDAHGPLTRLLESHDVLVKSAGDGGGQASKATIPLSPTKLALDEIESYRGTESLIDLEQWVCEPAGAANAVRFTRAVRGALRSFPDKEATHTIERVRCPNCELLSLVWHPPVMKGDAVRIDCRNPECGYVLDQDAFDKELEHPTKRKETA